MFSLDALVSLDTTPQRSPIYTIYGTLEVMPAIKVINSPNFDWLHRSTNQIDSNYYLLLVKYLISCRRCLSIVFIVSLSYFAGSVESLVGV